MLSGPPQKPTHSEMTSCEQLHFNYYQLTSFLLWFSCFVVVGGFFFNKVEPINMSNILQIFVNIVWFFCIFYQLKCYYG